jgi:predicted HNH restriction endonuclease
MGRERDFTNRVKKAAITRQGGFCAFCGVTLQTPWTEGKYSGAAHHLRPILHGGTDGLDNCVYLCPAHHFLIGHGMAPLGIDKQGGSADSWVQLKREDFEYWESECAAGGT